MNDSLRLDGSRRRSLLVHPGGEGGEIQTITPASAGWEHLHFSVRRLRRGEHWNDHTAGLECGLVVLGGVATIASSRGNWTQVGRRPDVFSGMPYALYLPPRTEFSVTALSDDLLIARGGCAAPDDHPARLVTPADVTIEIRGGGTMTRQINSIFPPGFPCHRLVAVEVYTPPGNWSSYPPHKHDVHRLAPDGVLLEADLEEIYFYQLDRPHGFAIQRVYTSDGRLDESLIARHHDVVLVPEGYHPVASGPGYTTYYLNFLAGSAQSLANADDPDQAWVKSTWLSQDPRLPIVTPRME